MAKNNFFIALFALWALGTQASDNKYVAFLTDKANSSYTLENPGQFLSERALQRKNKLGISVSEEDLPVSDFYLQQLAEYEVEILHTSRWFNAVLIEADEETANELSGLGFIREINLVAHSDESGANSRRRHGRSATRELSSEWFPFVTNALQNRMLGVDEMHKKGFMGEGMRIAIFDSGFQGVDQSSFYSHLHQNDRLVYTRDLILKTGNVFQYDNHGSKALSTIAAYSENEYLGVAYNAEFVLCVTEDVGSEYPVEEYYWLIAAELADSLGTDIISSSLAYTTFDDPSMNYTYSDLDGHTAVITKAAKMAASRGMIVVTSAGNDGNKSWKYINAPADADSILAVGAVNMDMKHSSFSSFGPSADGRIKPELCALGTSVKVVSGENIYNSNGTSFSTPLVSGLVAGFWQAFPELNSFEVMEILKSTASNSLAPDTVVGYGVPNFIEAFNKAADIEETAEDTFVVYPNPVDGSKIFVASSGFLDIGKVKVNFADFKGAVVKDIEVQVFSPSETLEIDISDLGTGYYLTNFTNGSKKKTVKLIVL